MATLEEMFNEKMRAKRAAELPAKRKIYHGPFGQYEAGSIGAVLNALCEQERIYSTGVSNWKIGNGKVFNFDETKVIATFEWIGDEIKFFWINCSLS